MLFLGYGYRWLRPRDNMTVRFFLNTFVLEARFQHVVLEAHLNVLPTMCFQHEVPTRGACCAEQVGHFMERSAPIVRAMPPLPGAHELTPAMRSQHPELARPEKRCLGALAAVSRPWVPAWGSLEPPRQDGEDAQKTGKNGEKTGKRWARYGLKRVKEP